MMFGEGDARWLNVKAASDMTEANLRAIGEVFLAAHETCRGGLSIEIGTRNGGSAKLFAELLLVAYVHPPPLWTVDPYGSKPYIDGVSIPLPLYHDDVEYVAMKTLLAPYSFHSHWKMESREFFEWICDTRYWAQGDKEVVVIGGGKSVKMPIGEPKRARNASFILLDGEHSAQSIAEDVTASIEWLAPGGTLVVDNIDVDSKTVPWLKRVGELDWGQEDFSRAWAVGRLKL